MITLRASGFSEWMDCAARAEAKQLLGKRTPGGPNTVIGSALHASTAAYDTSTITGGGLTIDDAAGAAVDFIQQPDYDVDWADSEPAKAERIALALHTRYCNEIAPTQNYAAVEVTCDRLEITDLGIALSGTTDRLRNDGDGFGISDLKSGGNAVRKDGYVETKGAAYQIGVYELLAEQASGLDVTQPARVVGLQVAKTDRGQRVGISQPISGARSALVGDEDSPGVLQAVAHMINTGTFVGNPRSTLCSPRYCPIYDKCKFRM